MKVSVYLISLFLMVSTLVHAKTEIKSNAMVPEQSSEVGRFPANSPRYPKYVEECRKAAAEKLKSIAKLNAFEMDESTISVSSIDDRWYNPSKYVWFSAVVKKADGGTEAIQVLTQKSFVPVEKCF